MITNQLIPKSKRMLADLTPILWFAIGVLKDKRRQEQKKRIVRDYRGQRVSTEVVALYE